MLSLPCLRFHFHAQDVALWTKQELLCEGHDLIQRGFYFLCQPTLLYPIDTGFGFGGLTSQHTVSVIKKKNWKRVSGKNTDEEALRRKGDDRHKWRQNRNDKKRTPELNKTWIAHVFLITQGELNWQIAQHLSSMIEITLYACICIVTVDGSCFELHEACRWL